MYIVDLIRVSIVNDDVILGQAWSEIVEGVIRERSRNDQSCCPRRI
jgi:hypothetical protein